MEKDKRSKINTALAVIVALSAAVFIVLLWQSVMEHPQVKQHIRELKYEVNSRCWEVGHKLEPQRNFVEWLLEPLHVKDTELDIEVRKDLSRKYWDCERSYRITLRGKEYQAYSLKVGADDWEFRIPGYLTIPLGGQWYAPPTIGDVLDTLSTWTRSE